METYFDFKNQETDFKTEVIAGITTFLATMYIIVVNPAILANTGMPFSGRFHQLGPTGFALDPGIQLDKG